MRHKDTCGHSTEERYQGSKHISREDKSDSYCKTGESNIVLSYLVALKSVTFFCRLLSSGLTLSGDGENKSVFNCLVTLK